MVFYTEIIFSDYLFMFRHATFFTTVNHLQDLPQTSAEIAFVGRSNAGKSSALNTLAGHTRLAFVSKTPGRTQHINYFQLKNGGFLADLPGYGFAEVPESVRKHWVHLLGEYLKTRESLIGLLLIMDCRHPLKDLDRQMLDFFQSREQQQPVHILLSKADKLSRQEQIKTLAKVRKDLKTWSDNMPVTVQLFSSLKKTGIEECESIVSQWFQAAYSSCRQPEK
ncbi:MAG: YihA family ribosome biogenesis GTP-binding protein [Neisseriaceae bacterium]|nr:YihA family ribosome biogenesis GTP-binding protein [Neisseriaceae bacterium]